MSDLAAKFREAADGASDVARISVSAADLRRAADLLDEHESYNQLLTQDAEAEKEICQAWNWGANNIRYPDDVKSFGRKMERAICLLPGVTKK